MDEIATTRHHFTDACLCQGTQVFSRGAERIQFRMHHEDKVSAIARLRQNDNVVSDGRRRRGGKRGGGVAHQSNPGSRGDG